jgi:hypothetical protein
MLAIKNPQAMGVLPFTVINVNRLEETFTIV